MAANAKDIIVIGGGFGGLSAAIRLTLAGHRVTLLEKRDQLGGRAYQYAINGFRFDGGPTVITAPHLFDDLFALAGRRREDYFQLVPLDPYYRIFDPAGRTFDYQRDPVAMCAQIEAWNPGDVRGYNLLSRRVERIFAQFYRLTERPFLRLSDMLGIMPAMLRLGAIVPMYHYAALHLKDPFLRQVFSFHPLLIGGSPLDTPSIFALIMQVEREWGVHYAVGGTGAIVAAMGRLLAELGATICLNTEVRQIIIRDRQAVGVKLADGTEIAADAIVCNGDTSFAYRHLIAPEHQRPLTRLRIERLAYSFSLMVIYFGTNRRYTETPLRHHNVILTGSTHRLLRQVNRARGLPDDLALYLHMPTITDPTIAPEGCESFYVLAIVPNLRARIDWAEVGPTYRDRIMTYLENHYLPGLQDSIVAEHRIDPVHFATTLNSYRGAAFGVRPSLLQSAWLRPHNRSDEFENLYFVGASTHPGAGIPAVLASGKIAADLIAKRG
jgi:phytoene desaturase